MTVVVHNPLFPDPLFLHPDTLLPHRPQPHTMPDNTQLSHLPSFRRKAWANVHSPLHDTVREVRISLALPAAVLQTPADDRTSASCSLHNVHRLVRSVIGAGGGMHHAWLVSHNYDLAAARIYGGVHHTAQFRG